MQATDFIGLALEASKGWAEALLRDMTNAPHQAPTPNGGNHPHWVLGHLVFSEAMLFDVFVQGRENRVAEWGELFQPGTTPCPKGNGYPSMDDLLAKWDEIRADVVAHLNRLSAEDLDAKACAPDEFGKAFGSVAKCYSSMSGHVSFHSGQVADSRRAAGRDPLAM